MLLVCEFQLHLFSTRRTCRDICHVADTDWRNAGSYQRTEDENRFGRINLDPHTSQYSGEFQIREDIADHGFISFGAGSEMLFVASEDSIKSEWVKKAEDMMDQLKEDI